MTTSYALLINIALLSFAAVLVFILVVSLKLPLNSVRRAVISGLIYGAASVLVVNFPIEGPLGSSFDTRAGPILIASYYGGPISGLIAGTLGAIARYNVGGPAAWGGVLSCYLYALAGLMFRAYFNAKTLNTLHLSFLSVFATCLVIPAFFVGQPFAIGLQILKQFWLVLLTGNVIGVLILGLIVQKMRELVSAQREYDAILSASPDGIITIDRNFNIRSMNPAATRMFGWTIEDLSGKSIDTLVPKEVRPEHSSHTKGFFNDESAIQREMTGYRIVEGEHQNGRRFPILVSLAKYIANGEVMVAATIHDMTEIKASRVKLMQMTDKLVTQLGEAHTANDAKNRFLANMSHELRTPLNAIIGFSEMMAGLTKDKISVGKFQEYARDIKFSGETLLGMINDILDISKIESDQTDIDIQICSASNLVDHSLKLVEANAKERRIEFIRSGNLHANVLCDMRTATQAITNLLTNAIKYSPVGSNVFFFVESDERKVSFVVEDQGVGIPEQIISRIGEPFLRGTTPEIRDTEGAGLGLALSKKLIERQNGRLTIQRGRQRGTKARIELPAYIRSEIAEACD